MAKEYNFTEKQLRTYGYILMSMSFTVGTFNGVMLNSLYNDYKELKDKLNTELKSNMPSIEQKPSNKIHHLKP